MKFSKKTGRPVTPGAWHTDPDNGEIVHLPDGTRELRPVAADQDDRACAANGVTSDGKRYRYSAAHNGYVYDE